MPNAPDLHVHSSFSTWDGMGSPSAVVERGVELGWGAVCLTEHGWMGSAPLLYQACKAAKVKPIIGCEIYVVPDHMLIRDKSTEGSTRHLTVLALSFEGYQNLVTWQNWSMRSKDAFYYKPRISLERMLAIAPYPLHHNVILSGCMNGELCHTLLNTEMSNELASYAAESYVGACASAFPHFYIELQNHQHAKFADRGFEHYDAMIAHEAAARDMLLVLAQKFDVPVIVTNDSHFQVSGQRKAHMAMLARKGGQRQIEGYIYWMSYMRAMEPTADTLPSWAAKQAIQSIHEIVEEADVVLSPLDKFSYSIPRSGYDDPVATIRKRCKTRLRLLVERHGTAAEERFDFELEALAEFGHYLLLVADVVKLMREQGIYSWTRGSAANSMVCFCLGIHEIDSIHYKLMFERFVNPARKKMPDVDIDIEGHRQADVAKILDELMTATEGKGQVKAICTYSTVANRAAFRTMAVAQGVPQERIDELAKIIPSMIDSGMVSEEAEAYELLKDEYPELHELAEAVFDAIAGVSQHACAFALGTEERPLHVWIPDYHIASSGAHVTQYNMKSIEEMGFLKMDLLKLDTLTIMHNIARMLGKDMAWLDSIMQSEEGIYGVDDKKTFRMLREGRTEGVHSFQGATQRRGCIAVGIKSDFDAIAVQALYRPSGTRTGLEKHFCDRRHGREEWASLNDITAKHLNETYGIAIYQEQIMEMGVTMGMSGEEIDDLYKAIKTAKGVGRGAAELFEKFKPTYMRYALDCMSKEEADEVWQEWDKLQGYTFNRGHATSYGLLACKTAFLKAHYPQEFFAAILERYPDNPRYVAAAKSEGFEFESPDINSSSAGFSRGAEKNGIRVGLLRVRGLGPGATGEIQRHQPFQSVDDLRERTNNQRVDRTVVENLGRVGALESLGIRGEEDDTTDFQLMNFVLRRPKAFDKCNPKMPPRNGSKWKFLGLTDSVLPQEGKVFCAKMFWLPDLDGLLNTKASGRGTYSAHLLTVVDENGLPFDLIVPEDKVVESKLIKLLAKEARGSVITAEGQLAMPFLRNGNPGFKLWGITGAEYGHPQMWHTRDLVKKAVAQLAREKDNQPRRRRAA